MLGGIHEKEIWVLCGIHERKRSGCWVVYMRERDLGAG